MSLTTLTIEGEAFHAYATLLDAARYLTVDLDGRLAAWLDRTEVERLAALAGAARYLDTLNWSGRRMAAEQAGAWPRAGVVRLDGRSVGATTIPHELESAAVEIAASGLHVDAAASILAEAVGPKRVRFARRGPSATGNTTADALVGQFLRSRTVVG